MEWLVNKMSHKQHTNNNILICTTTTSNGILSVLTIRAVPINVGKDEINVDCLCTAPTYDISKPATLTIRGTIFHY